jgi:hypothetical protein
MAAGTFADHLSDMAATYYGTAAPAFLERLADDRQSNPELLSRALRDSCAAFMAKLRLGGNGGQTRSVAMKFALIAAAGELATRYGILPWAAGEATAGVKKCLEAWLDERDGGSRSAEAREAVRRVRSFLAHHAARFQPLHPDKPDTEAPFDGPRIILDRAGWMRRQENILPNGTTTTERQFFFLEEVWKELFAGMDAKAAARDLNAAGWLLTNTGRLQRGLRVPGHGRFRCYAVKGDILG